MQKNRVHYHHGNLRQALLSAALELLDDAGVEGVTIRAVARRAGVAHSAPANHFRDRRALLTCLAAGIFSELAAEIQQSLTSKRLTGPARVRRFADVLLAFGLRHPHRYRLLWRRDLLDDSDAALQAPMDLIYDSLVKELEACDSTHPESPHTQAVALWSLMHGYVSMRLDGNLRAKKDELTGRARERAIIDVLLRGIYSS